MAEIKVLKSVDGYNTEHDDSTDSIKMLSVKTANYELTDTLLGLLVSGGDGSSAHTHDSVYFTETEHINSSAGAADAGKPIVLDAAGLIDGSMIDDGDIDHGGLAGLADDDHTQYSLAAGTRDYTGIVQYSSHPSFTADTDIVDKKYVDDLFADPQHWYESCLDILLAPPGSPSTGDRYLINGVGTGAWAGQDYDIAEWNGSAWVFTTPDTGSFVSVDDETDGVYYFGGTGPWVKKQFESTTASLGCEKVGTDIRLDLLASGGLKLTGNEVGVEPGDFAGEGLTDDGSDNMAIDWSTAFNDAKAVKANDLNSTTNGEGASIIGIEDAGGYLTATNVEGALAELATSILEDGVDYTVGTGGVTKGDLLYVSANDTVNSKSSMTSANWGVGLAATTVAAASTVKSIANDVVLSGVLSGATAGTRYYWNGTTHVSTVPTGSGSYVWQTGVAKNATDLQVEIMFIKKNA